MERLKKAWNIAGFACSSGWLVLTIFLMIKHSWYITGNTFCMTEPIAIIAQVEIVALFVGLAWLIGRVL